MQSHDELLVPPGPPAGTGQCSWVGQDLSLFIPSPTQSHELQEGQLGNEQHLGRLEQSLIFLP